MLVGNEKHNMGKNAIDYNKPLAVKRMSIEFPQKFPKIKTQATIPPAISYCRQNAEYPNIKRKPLRTPANLYVTRCVQAISMH